MFCSAVQKCWEFTVLIVFFLDFEFYSLSFKVFGVIIIIMLVLLLFQIIITTTTITTNNLLVNRAFMLKG